MPSSFEDDAAAVVALDASTLRDTASPGFGVTAAGFSPKPFARLLAEKMVLARALLGEDVDLSSGAVLRKLLEVAALEDARTWAALAATYDDMFVATARGPALTRLGEELGLPRPHEAARGHVALRLLGDPPPGPLVVPRGARMLTPGGHHVATSEAAVLSGTARQARVAVEAFHPGPSHDLDPGAADGDAFPQRIDRWHRADPKLADLGAAERAAGRALVAIEHAEPLTGGDRLWPDLRYRQLLLRAPRSIWTLAAVEMAVALVPGVRQVQVQDRRGGLDLQQSIFGNVGFIERLFAAERDLGSPYYFSVLVAPTPAAIWDGPDGLRAALEQALEDVRPIGIFPLLREAQDIGVGVSATLVVRGLPLPTGPASVVNASAAAAELRARLHARIGRYVDGLRLGEPVRVSEVVWALMSEPGVADARDVRLLQFPAEPMLAVAGGPAAAELPVGANLDLQSHQVPVYVPFEAPPRLAIA